MNTPKGTDLFPFGKNKTEGKRYEEVPVSWYRWFMMQEWSKSWPQVIAYWKENEDGMTQDEYEMDEELGFSIWDTQG